MARQLALMRASFALHRLGHTQAPALTTRALAPTLGLRAALRASQQHSLRPAASVSSPAAMAEVLPKVNVRIPAGDGLMAITLVAAGKQRNLNRPKDEPLQKCLFRLRSNVQPTPNARKTKKRPPTDTSAPETPAAITASLYRDADATQLIDEGVSNADAWRDACLLVLGSERFTVQVNAPTVDKITLPKRPMVGYTLLPVTECEFADTHLTRWEWARREKGGGEWVSVGSDELYTPSTSDVGCSLRCTVTAGRQRHPTTHTSDHTHDTHVLWGDPVSVVSEPVSAAPVRDSHSVRCVATHDQPVPAPGMRVLSYNLLADQYAASEYAQTVLFNYCPTDNLDPEYRLQLILKELLGYSADILCLQEVDAKAYTEFLTPNLAKRGYRGHYTNKQGKVREGSATFWRTSRFTQLLSVDILLRHVFKQPLGSNHAQWQPMLDASPELVHALQKVTTVAQVTLLQPAIMEEVSALLNKLQTLAQDNSNIQNSNTNRKSHTDSAAQEAEETNQPEGVQLVLCNGEVLARVANSPGAPSQQPPPSTQGSTTESTWEPAQVDTHTLLTRVATQLGGAQPALLFCGDLNSDLNDGMPGVVSLLSDGRLSSDHWDWHMGANFRWGMNEEDGDPEQQAAAPQPPGSAIAAAVAAAKSAATTVTHTAIPTPTTTQQTQHTNDPTTTTNNPINTDTNTTVANDNKSSCSVRIVGVDVTSPFQLRSADDLKTPFTNYTSGYKALLDYVWYQPQYMKVTRVHPTPTEEELGSFIPSPAFPSDHLAVVYDFEPTSKTE